jgi:hypothetical protein
LRPARLPCLLVLLTIVLVVGVPVAASADVPGGPYTLPVDGAVLRHFHAPDHAYGPGHRGVDLAVPPGGSVHAAAGGEVAFVGTVAGHRWVSVDHGDGVRTSYGAMRTTDVQVGDRVTRGERLGTATGTHGEVLRPEAGLHWSARRGGAYIDPLTLLGSVPRPTLVGEGGWRPTAHPNVPYARYEGGSRLGILATPSPTAREAGYAVPPNGHRLLQVQGYGTFGPQPLIDPADLGIDPADSHLFSYAGCEPTARGCAPRPYGGQDTDLTEAQGAELLDRQLRALQRAEPNRPVDLLGHSMGGAIIAYWVEHLHDPHDLGLPPVVNLIPVGAPLGGSGAAALPRAVGDDAVLGRFGEAGRRLAAAAGWDAAGRVSLVSRPVETYGAPAWWGRPARAPGSIHPTVRVLELAGSRDAIVGRTDAGSVGRATVLPGGHGTVLDTEVARQAIYDFLREGAVGFEVDSRVGVGSDITSDAARTVATMLDLWPGRTILRAARLGDRKTVVYEGGKAAVGGPENDAPAVPRGLRQPSFDHAPASGNDHAGGPSFDHAGGPSVGLARGPSLEPAPGS